MVLELSVGRLNFTSSFGGLEEEKEKRWIDPDSSEHVNAKSRGESIVQSPSVIPNSLSRSNASVPSFQNQAIRRSVVPPRDLTNMARTSSMIWTTRVRIALLGRVKDKGGELENG